MDICLSDIKFEGNHIDNPVAGLDSDLVASWSAKEVLLSQTVGINASSGKEMR